MRKQLRSARKALSPESRLQKSRAIAERLFHLPEYRRAAAVMAYVSYGSEVDTSFIIRQVLSDRKILSLPKVEGDFMLFMESQDLENFTRGYAGIPEPQDGRIFDPAAFTGPILMLMPGIGFDEEKNRLGQGGGFYDRYLAGYPDLTTIALAYEVQMTDHIPTETTDLKPDFILTEKRLI